MKFNKIKQNKLKFKLFSNNSTLFTFNLNFNKIYKNLNKLIYGNILTFNKFKIEEHILKLQYIKSKIIKLTSKNNLIKLNYKDITTKNYKQGLFTIYLNSPIITSLNI